MTPSSLTPRERDGSRSTWPLSASACRYSGDGFRRLDAEPLADLADARLVGVAAQIINNVVEDAALELREGCGMSASGGRSVPDFCGKVRSGCLPCQPASCFSHCTAWSMRRRTVSRPSAAANSSIRTRSGAGERQPQRLSHLAESNPDLFRGFTESLVYRGRLPACPDRRARLAWRRVSRWSPADRSSAFAPWPGRTL